MPNESLAEARSFLFVPGDRPERFDRACASGADRIIIDLEDAVAPSRKALARQALAAWLTPSRRVLVRINTAGSPDWEADVHLCAQARIGGLVLAKAETVEELLAVQARLPEAQLLPLVETARGLAQAATLAAGLNVVRLIFGSIDFQLDLGIPEDGEPLAAFRSQLVFASRLGGAAPPVDGVTTNLTDHAVLQADVARARVFGFGGKLCIHPRQVEAVNTGFSPTPSERTWAERVVASAATAEGGAIAVDGQMIDRPIVLRAQAILARATAAGLAETN